MIISNESSKNREISKYSLSNKNFERSKISFSHSRSDFVAKNKYKTNRKQEFRRKSNIGRFITRIKENKSNKLNKIFEEEKGENLSNNIIENNLIRKPKLSMKEINKIIGKSYFKVEVSEDGGEFKSVIENGTSSGENDYFDIYDLGGTRARYVKIYGLGNNSSSSASWNSITEIAVSGE